MYCVNERLREHEEKCLAHANRLDSDVFPKTVLRNEPKDIEMGYRKTKICQWH